MYGFWGKLEDNPTGCLSETHLSHISSHSVSGDVSTLTATAVDPSLDFNSHFERLPTEVELKFRWRQVLLVPTGNSKLGKAREQVGSDSLQEPLLQIHQNLLVDRFPKMANFHRRCVGDL